jgi:hypothetical protein
MRLLDEWRETTRKRRLLIGELLDILGDPRPGKLYALAVNPGTK